MHRPGIFGKLIKGDRFSCDFQQYLGVPKMQLPENGWFIMQKLENPIKMDDLGVLPFQETPIKEKNSGPCLIQREARGSCTCQ